MAAGMISLLTLHSPRSLSWNGAVGVAGLYNLGIVRFGILVRIPSSMERARLTLSLCANSRRTHHRGGEQPTRSALRLPRVRRASPHWRHRHPCGGVLPLARVSSTLRVLPDLSRFADAEPPRPYTYSAIPLWSAERLLRLLRFVTFPSIFRLRARSPVYQTTATLVHGAIILRVPNTSPWSAAQHSFLPFPGISALLGQNHPFSIANVPASNGSESPSMLFVMRVRGGMTRTLARKLEKEAIQSMQLLAGVEGAYGRPTGAKLFHDVLRRMRALADSRAVLDDLVHNAKERSPRTTRIQLIWVIQHAGDSSSHSTSISTLILRTLSQSKPAGSSRPSSLPSSAPSKSKSPSPSPSTSLAALSILPLVRYLSSQASARRPPRTRTEALRRKLGRLAHHSSI